VFHSVPKKGRGISQEVILSLTAAIDGEPTLYMSAPPMIRPKHSLKKRVM